MVMETIEDIRPHSNALYNGELIQMSSYLYFIQQIYIYFRSGESKQSRIVPALYSCLKVSAYQQYNLSSVIISSDFVTWKRNILSSHV